MSESKEELDQELVASIRNLTEVHSEYARKYISPTPLGDGPVPVFTFDELHEITNRIIQAEERYSVALRKMRGFERGLEK